MEIKIKLNKFWSGIKNLWREYFEIMRIDPAGVFRVFSESSVLTEYT